jgi:hypothetical protein
VDFRLGDVIGTGDLLGDPFVIRPYSLTGSLAFYLNADLARATAASTGTYFGHFTAAGIYRQYLSDPGFLNDPQGIGHNISGPNNSIEVTGATVVPEPSAYVLLLTILGWIGVALRRKTTAPGSR